ncbi:MAG: glutamate--cysteine ligase [Alphaproteobacteria bacterium]|nr:glutamate--cysteine ligase [Alphaproteobacteria bacterium]
MSVPSKAGEPVTSKRQLVDYLAAGSKPPPAWRMGTEHEKFVFRRDDRRRVPYEGPGGIRALLEAMRQFGWQPVIEKGNPVALTQGMASITLEPGGQFELSGATLETMHETRDELDRHFAQLRQVMPELGIAMHGLGFDPKWRRDDIGWMPKGRYKIMREYMPKKGKLGLDMMLRTATVQVNLDFQSEADMVKKFQVSLALQPLATALFANSPFTEGKPNGYLSYRSHVWTDTDPDRCGMLGFVFDAGFGFERYVDYLLDVPMYFVYRDGNYLDASGESFRDYMQGRLSAMPGQVPLITDWADHVTTAFPEVRLKRYLELRGADAGGLDMLCALPALWVGLLYDTTALDAAHDLIRDWSVEEMTVLRRDVPRLGLRAPHRGRPLRDVAGRVLAIARAGLKARARQDGGQSDETAYLAPIEVIAESGETNADRLLAAYRGRWRESVDPIFAEEAYR